MDRHNFTTMTRYINNPDNLKLMMNMLREKSRNIQFEAFHVFKVSSALITLTTEHRNQSENCNDSAVKWVASQLHVLGDVARPSMYRIVILMLSLSEP